VLQILKRFGPLDIAAMGPATFWSVHFMSEAGRLAFADRSVFMADPAFFSPPAGLLDSHYLRERSAHDPTGRESDEQDQEDPVQPSDTMEDFQES